MQLINIILLCYYLSPCNFVQWVINLLPILQDSFVNLTLLDGEVAHGEGHGVPREDVVTTVYVLPIDRETATGEEGYHSPSYV